MFEKQRNNKSDDSPAFESSPATPVSEPSPPSQPSPRRSALIGASIKIKGDVSGDENLVIDGQVEGTIEFASNEVTIGASGQVSANVTANMIRIDGEVKGDIAGHEKVIVSKTGKVQGNIVAPRVTLEDGAKFKGSIDMDPSERETAGASKAKPTTPVSISRSEASETPSSNTSSGS